MNRIKLGPLAKVPVPVQSESDSFSKYSPALEPNGLIHSLFIPMHYEESYSYPLIVWLHNECKDQRQLLRIMPRISMRNFVGVSVQGPDRHADGKYQWLQTSESIETALSDVQQAIELAANRVNINLSQVFAVGQGGGGTMAFRVAFQQPDLFAGVASINGSLPCALTPLSNWLKCRSLPLFWAHGRYSETFPEPNLCHQLRLLHVGGFSVTLRQYPSSDKMPEHALNDLNEWVMEQMAKSGRHNIIK